MSMRARSGAALVMALLLLVVLDCIVLGTLHISLQEHRIGQNRQGVLQLRLDAESAVRAVSGGWPQRLDSLATGVRTVVAVTEVRAHVSVERLGDDLFLLDAVAAEPAPRAGRAMARLLVHPPVLPPDVAEAPAPLSAGGSVRVMSTGRVSAIPSACSIRTDHAILLAGPASLTVDPGGVVDAPSGPLPDRPLVSEFARVQALSVGRAAVHSIVGDTTLSDPISGVLIVEGSITLQASAQVEGLLLVKGNLTLAAGSVFTGAAHVQGSATVGGEIRADPCLVKQTLEAGRFRSATPVRGRARIPAFGG